jgi:hypothetical protein
LWDVYRVDRFRPKINRSKDHPMKNNTDSAAGGAMPASDQAIAAGKLADGLDDTAGYALKAVLGAAEQKFEVALDWYEAEAWSEKIAAPPEPIARQAQPASSSSELLHVVDEVNHVRYQIYAAYMAARHLDRDESNAMQGVLGGALDRLTAARDRLDAARGAPERKAA